MSTLISQLPEEIRKKALINQQASTDYNKYTDFLTDAFAWGESPEGVMYWADVYSKYDSVLRQQIASIIDRRISRNEKIDLLVKLWEEKP